MRAMSFNAFLDGMSQIVVIGATPREESMRRAWESVGQDMWWAIEQFNNDNNLRLEQEQLEFPIASVPK